MAATWTPKYPEFAVDEATYGRTLSPDEGLDSTAYGDEPWTMSPATSHTEAFRLIDVRTPKFRWMKRIGRPSELHVRFRPDESNPAKQYSYQFPDHTEAERIYNLFAAAAHPWGEVGYPLLVLGKVKYRRLI